MDLDLDLDLWIQIGVENLRVGYKSQEDKKFTNMARELGSLTHGLVIRNFRMSYKDTRTRQTRYKCCGTEFSVMIIDNLQDSLIQRVQPPSESSDALLS